MPGHCHIEFILPEGAGSVCTPHAPFPLDSVEAVRTDAGAIIRCAVRGGSFVIIELDSQTMTRLGTTLIDIPIRPGIRSP